MKRFYEARDRREQMLLPPSLDEMVPADDPVRVIDTLVDELDLRGLIQRYPGGGRPAYHPRMMVKVLFYAYFRGITSSRKIAQALEENQRFIWLAQALTPDFRTISDFRKDNLEHLGELFAQIVVYAAELGMVSLGQVSIDGSRIKANASRRSLATREQIEKLLEEAERVDQAEDELYGKGRRGDELPEGLRDPAERERRIKEAKRAIEAGQQRASTTDPQARVQKTQAGLRPGYNAQAAVDEQSHVIVAADVVCDQNDAHQLGPMCEQVVRNLGPPGAVAADSGYWSQDSLDYIQAHPQVQVFLPPQQQEPAKQRGRFTYRDFDYDPQQDCYLCPGGRKLKFDFLEQTPNRRYRRYRTAPGACRGCKFAARCKRTGAPQKTIRVAATAEVGEQLKARANSPPGRAAQRLRRMTVEPVFGHIKSVLGCDSFSLRSLRKVRGEFLLYAIAHNLKKIVKHLGDQAGAGHPAMATG